MTIHTPDVIEHFEHFISPEPNTGCWLWAGSGSIHGYGQFHPIRGLTRAAHRMSWEIYNGSIPDGLCVLHHCDVRCCVNPQHLFLGTKKDNTRDMFAKGRNRYVLPKRRKLTYAKAEDIRRKRAGGSLLKALATEYGVTISSIWAICIGQNWQRAKADCAEQP